MGNAASKTGQRVRFAGDKQRGKANWEEFTGPNLHTQGQLGAPEYSGISADTLPHLRPPP